MIATAGSTPADATDAPAIGRYLADHKLVPDLVLVSPATRTRETWELLAPTLDA